MELGNEGHMQKNWPSHTGGGDSAILNPSHMLDVFWLELVLNLHWKLLRWLVLNGLAARRLVDDAVLHLLPRGDDGELVGRSDGRLEWLAGLRFVLARDGPDPSQRARFNCSHPCNPEGR